MSERQSTSGAGGGSKTPLDFINFPRGAIGKRGLPAARNARLPSIRNPRDLTLGGLSLGVTPKRTFVPNIPVRRERASTSNASQDNSKPKNSASGQEGKKDSRFERGRGRGRGRPEYIQTSGIFSEGIGDCSKKVPSFRFRNESEGPPKPQRPIKPTIKKEVKDEGQDRKLDDDKDILQNLLRDDFIDDGSDAEDDEFLTPVIYPVNCSAKSKSHVKREGKYSKDLIHLKKEKLEVKTEDMKEEMLPPMDVTDAKPSIRASKMEPEEAAELFTSKHIPEDHQLLFFQFPDVLGVPLQAEENHKPNAKNTQNSASSQDSSSATGVTLADFPEGYIGKLQVLKSGKTRLVLGSLVLDVKVGAPFNTLQELVSIRTNIGAGDMTVLGHVHHKLVCMPDVENLVSQCSV